MRSLDHHQAKIMGRMGGRATRGETKGSAKLTAEKVLAIRASTESQRVIAPKYGIHPTHVGDIRNRVVWKHI